MPCQLNMSYHIIKIYFCLFDLYVEICFYCLYSIIFVGIFISYCCSLHCVFILLNIFVHLLLVWKESNVLNVEGYTNNSNVEFSSEFFDRIDAIRSDSIRFFFTSVQIRSDRIFSLVIRVQTLWPSYNLCSLYHNLISFLSVFFFYSIKKSTKITIATLYSHCYYYFIYRSIGFIISFLFWALKSYI